MLIGSPLGGCDCVLVQECFRNARPAGPNPHGCVHPLTKALVSDAFLRKIACLSGSLPLRRSRLGNSLCSGKLSVRDRLSLGSMVNARLFRSALGTRAFSGRAVVAQECGLARTSRPRGESPFLAPFRPPTFAAPSLRRSGAASQPESARPRSPLPRTLLSDSFMKKIAYLS